MVVLEGKQQQQLWKRGITEMNVKIKFPWNKKKSSNFAPGETYGKKTHLGKFW